MALAEDYSERGWSQGGLAEIKKLLLTFGK
jgi:hypothetical protein